MKRLQKFLSCVLLFASVAVVCFAQSAGPSGGQVTPPLAGHGRGAKKVAPVQILFRSMNLSKDQAKQVKQVVEDNQKQVKQFREANPGDKQGLKALRDKLNADEDSSLQKIFNADQNNQWQAWQKESKLGKFLADYRALRAAQVTKDELKEVQKLKANARYDALVGIAKNPTDSASVEEAKTKAESDYQTGLAKILSSTQMQAYQAASTKS